jgi:glycerophosphoryl diester phosphodiesterase
MQSLDAGRWFDDGFAGETIPSLVEALEVARPFSQSIYLDIKAHPTWTRDRIRQVAELIESRLEGDRCYICSFDAALLASFAEVSSKLRLGYHAINPTEFRDRIEYAAERQGILVSLYRPLLDTPELVELARSRGVDVVAWTVDDPKVWQQLQAIGIRRVITNTLLDLSDVK